MQKRNPLLTALGAFLILLFTGGPILLAFVGSVVPDRVMFDPNRGLFDEVTLENYRFIFTGELPPAYLEVGRQPDDDLRRRAPGAALASGTARRSPSPRSPSTSSSAHRPRSSTRATLSRGRSSASCS